MGIKELQLVFEKIRCIDYDGREGGRYAYVQLMAYTRDCMNLLLSMDPAHEALPGLRATAELLNALVSLRFGAEHRRIFDQKREEFRVLEALLGTGPCTALPLSQVQEAAA